MKINMYLEARCSLVHKLKKYKNEWDKYSTLRQVN